jgi:serine/threonine-protein kinase
VTPAPPNFAAALADRYRIERELGAGGMATVYLAHDVRHARAVAIKVLRPELAAALGHDRFLREITTTASLRHPHILPLYDSGEAAGLLFYVMPYVEGESLRDRLRRERQLPLEDALRITREVADALSYAHAHGIVHRDIKPENVLLESRHAVITDFGIARAIAEAGGTSLTQTGLAVGTPVYMSPEQAVGERELDGRSDVYSLGCVLYEMLTGTPPFTGPTAERLMHQHLAAPPPPVTRHRPEVPAAIAAALDRALAKDPANRFSSAEQFLAALEPSRASGSAARSASRSWRRVAVAAASVAVALVALLVARPRAPAPAPSAAVTLRQVTFSREIEEYPALSPDGRRLVFSRDVDGRRLLVLLDLESGAESALTHGEFDHIQATWTPDGQAVLFVRATKPRIRLQPVDVFGVFQDGDLWRRDLAGGSEERLIAGGFNPAVSPDGRRIAFDATRAGTRRLWVADERGRNAQQVSLDSSEAVAHVLPRWSPDGTRLAFQSIERTKFDIRVVDVATRVATTVTDDAFLDVNPVWIGADVIAFSSYRSGGINIWQVSVKPDGTPAGPPQQITTGAGQDLQLTVPVTGDRLAFTVLQLNADLWLLPVDPASGRPRGEPRAVVATTREDSRGAWSHDGRLLAFNSDRGGEMNIWVHALADGSDRQVTQGSGGDYQPQWSPDGRHLVFFSSRGGNADIWVVEPDGTGLSRLTSSAWLDINPMYSPDGRLIAFQSDRGGRMEVWLMNADGTEQRAVSRSGAAGHFEVWEAGGHTLLFRANDAPAARLVLATGRAEPLPVRGGAHLSLAPGGRLVSDVLEHRQLWVSPLSGGAPYQVFAFDDPDIRIDYPVWSPDGRWIVFDRLKPEGGDIWMLERPAAPR